MVIGRRNAANEGPTARENPQSALS